MPRWAGGLASCRVQRVQTSHSLRDEGAGLDRLVDAGESREGGEVASDEERIDVSGVVIRRRLLTGRSRYRKVEMHDSARTRRQCRVARTINVISMRDLVAPGYSIAFRRIVETDRADCSTASEARRADSVQVSRLDVWNIQIENRRRWCLCDQRDERFGKSRSGVPWNRIRSVANRSCETPHSELRCCQCCTDRSGMQCRSTDVHSEVYSRKHDVRSRSEATHTREDHAERGRAVHPVCRNILDPFDVKGAVLDSVAAVERTDSRACATPVLERGDDHDLVSGSCGGRRQRSDARGLDSVIVGHQNAHASDTVQKSTQGRSRPDAVGPLWLERRHARGGNAVAGLVQLPYRCPRRFDVGHGPCATFPAQAHDHERGPMPRIANEKVPPSGRQYEIGYGHHRVVVTEVGAALRAFSASGREVIDGFDVGQRCVDGRGQVLAPWPNRLGDGRYTFEGIAAGAALDEPEHHNAIHGLVRWLPWALLGQAQNVVTLGVVLHPQPGYPWRLSLTIEYRLGREGLVVTTEAKNTGENTAPFGLGFHPYLKVGTSTIDSVRLVVPARRRLVTDQRGLPTGEADVKGSEFDFSTSRLIGPIVLDTGYTDLSREDDGTARVELAGADDGEGTTVWADSGFSYLMVYTADKVGDVQKRRASIAIEPMTCPPDALRSGRSVIHLAPEASWRGSWGISPH